MGWLGNERGEGTGGLMGGWGRGTLYGGDGEAYGRDVSEWQQMGIISYLLGFKARREPSICHPQ